MHRKHVGILLFTDVEAPDFAGPYEAFTVARLTEKKRREEASPFEVRLIVETTHPVTTIAGMRSFRTASSITVPPLDILVIPGGWGVRKEITNERLFHWIKSFNFVFLSLINIEFSP